MKKSMFAKIAPGAAAMFVFLLLAPRAAAQMDQDPVSSSGATISYGSSFTPSYYGGDGGGGWQFMVSGYTSWTIGESPDSGTEYSSSWHSSWTPPSAGSYSFWVAHDGDWEYNPSDEAGAYTLTVNKVSQASVSSLSTSVAYGTSFTPGYSGGSGTGGWQFYISGYSTWNTGTTSNTGTEISSTWYAGWSPTAPGTYTFYVVRDGDTNYNTSSTAGPYTLTVTKGTQASVSSTNGTINFDGTTQSYPAFTPILSGGSGSGGWQFCVSDYTSWDGGITSYTGTNLTSDADANPGSWVSGWAPSAPGSYTFYIARDEDSNYNASAITGPYTLTVNGPVDGITWNSISLPSSGTAGQPISFTANVSNSGSSYWNGNYYLELKDAGGVISYTSISGIYPGSSISPTFSPTLPSTEGSHTYTFTAIQLGVAYFGGGQTASIMVLPVVPSITSATTASGTYATPFSYQITGSNTPTSYGASGLPGFLSVNTSTGVISGTPTSTGTWSIGLNATNDGGTGGTTTLTLTINPLGASFTGSPTLFTYDGSSHGPTITATPSGATYSTTGATASSVGSYTLTVTANGYYTGSSSVSWSIAPVSQPTALAATGSSSYTSYVQLSWTASWSANGGVYYKIYRDGSLAGTSATATYVDLSASTGSHSYYVVAYDATGGNSSASSSVSGTAGSGTSIATLLSVGTGTNDSVTVSPLNFQVLQPSQ